jgi:nickel-dependent lactate racemase
MNITLAFDKAGAEIEIPAGLRTTVLEPRYAAEVPDAGAALQAALRNPIQSLPLEELARGKKSAVIAVCDITRPAPNRIVLPHVTAALEKGGIPRSQISILIATGLHREATAAELEEIVGREMLSRYAAASHRARVEAEQVFLGETSSGTKVYIDRRFVEADLHVTLGFVEPHLMAGFSGGRKLIAPGCAGETTIKRLHSPHFMRNAQVSEGCYPDNPLHRDLLEIARMAGHHFIVDVALTRTRGISAVFAGDPAAAHAEGVRFVRESTLAAVEEPADAVVTTSGGYPLDLTYYQAIKGVTAAAHVVKEGGTVLLVAACAEGLGSPEFSELVRRAADWKALLAELETSPVRIDQWQAEKLALVASKARLSFCLPGIAREDRRCLWGPAFDSPQQAVDDLAARIPRGGSLVVIPEGPYVFSQLEPATVGV